MSYKKRKELQRLVGKRETGMATIVKMQASVTVRGGGDHEGDTDTVMTRDQFVHTDAKASLGWCLGVHMSHMAEKILTTPGEMEEFKNAICSCLDETLQTIRDDLSNIE